MEHQERFDKAMAVKATYNEFLPFLYDGMNLLGFKLSAVQADIAEYMMGAPGQKRAVFAQRGEAKTTIACIGALWALVQNPAARVAIVSAVSKRAYENAFFIRNLMHRWDVLEYLRPDKNGNDRDNKDSLDVHYILKGIDKSPSVSSVSIGGGFTGARSDFIIADDIEIPENSATPALREKILAAAREFTAVNTVGTIVYLGTPQTKDSVYHTLRGMGVEMRIWPGRYPSAEHIESYGDSLAPSIAAKLQKDPTLGSGGGLDGTRGKPTDPKMLNEKTLREKEEQGVEFFELQYMLNTRLSDAMRQQLKLKDLIVIETGKRVPEVLDWAPDMHNSIPLPNTFPVKGVSLHKPGSSSREFTTIGSMVMTVDPASEGGDEVAFACGGTVGPYIHVTDWGGLKGGMTEDNMTRLLDIAEENDCKNIIVERNFGGGIATQLLISHASKLNKSIGISDQHSTKQKEKRIIDCVGPIQRRHRLVMHWSAVERDLSTIMAYPADKRAMFSGLYQMDSITTTRGCLIKDDRIDVLEQLCRYLSPAVLQDEHKAAEMRRQEEIRKFIEDPLGLGSYNAKPRRRGTKPQYLTKRFGVM